MNEAEALKVILILLDSGGGCPACAQESIDKFARTFPQYAEIALMSWFERYVPDGGHEGEMHLPPVPENPELN